MRKRFNRLTSLLIAVAIIFSLLPMSFAMAETTFPDFPTGWSKPAMEAAVENGLISGYEDGMIRPKGNLTRAEMATIITKAFGATVFGEVSAFKDVKEGSWYYNSISRAVKMGAISGRSATEMAPNAAITRQEVFTILARVLVLSNEDTSSLNKFSDASEIASWAAPSMAALTERGYVNGDNLGNANPRDNITREEFAQLMYMAIRTYITERGTHTGSFEGITVIRVSGVTIKDASVTSDLVLGDGAGTGKVTIENINVEKRLLVRGGAIAVIRETTLGENVVVNNVNGITYFDNYRDEPVFEGIVENTIAKFKERSSSGGSGGGGGSTPSSPSPSPSPSTQFTLSFNTNTNNVNVPLNFVPGFTPTTTFPADSTTITLPGADKVVVPVGYTFNGWKTSVTGDSLVTEIAVTTGMTTSITVTADIGINTYPITYLNQADNSPVSFVGGYTAPATYTVETPVTTLPDATKVTANLGYKLKEWVDGNGDPVTSISVTGGTTNAGMTVYAVYEPITYNVEYYEPNSTTPVTFVVGYAVPYTYDITSIPTLPTVNDVVAPAGKELAEWRDENGNPVAALTVTDTTPATLKLYAVWQDAPITNYIVHYADSNNDPVTFVSGQEPQTSYPAGTTTITLPPVSSVVAPLGYVFNGWLYNGSPATTITITNTTPAHINVIADLSIKTYNVTFKNRDNSSITYVGLYQPPTIFNVNNAPALPTAAQVVAPVGYELSGWEDVDGNPVTSLTVTATTPDNLTLYPVYSEKTYILSFVEPDGTTAIQFVAGYAAPTSFTVTTAGTTILPAASDIVAPLGKIFDKWLDSNGQEVSALTVTDATPDTVVLKASYTNKQYNIVYDLGAGSFVPSFQPPLTFDVDNDATFPTAEKIVPPPGYTFMYWENSAGDRADGWEVTPFTPDTVYVYAKYVPKTYNIEYYEPNSTTPVTFVGGYNAPYTYDINNAPALPNANQVVAPVGKELQKWVDENGNPVTALTVTAATPETLKLYAVYKNIEYRIEYYFDSTTPAIFIAGYNPPLNFTVDTVDGVVLPSGDKLDLTGTGYTSFIEWRTDLTDPNTKVEEITLTEGTPAVIRLFAYCDTQYNVNFFEGMTNDQSYLLGTSPVDVQGHVVAFPDITGFGDKGYEETAEVASVYENNEYVHVTTPRWWYLDADNNLVEFTSETVVTDELNVYLLSKKFGLLLVFNSSNFPIMATASYNEDTRIVDSVKDLATSGGNQLKTAIALDMMPEYYDKAMDKLVAALEKSTVIKEENGKKNIQVVEATFKLSQFVKESMVNTLIKKYLHEVVKNPAELDRIFSMINVADFADQLGIDTIISGMTDAEIVSLMKSAENRGTVINFIITDLKKTDSAMLDFVIDYVINDASFREDLIDDLITELKNAGATSALKSQAIAYIKSQIEDTTSAFYDKFVTMVYDDLNSTNSVVMEAVVEFVRTNLGANTQAGKDLRKEILTSSMLATFLANAKMKEKVIELILTDSFIDTALDNVDFRKALVEAMMEYSVVENGEKVYPFIDELLASPVFHDYIVDQLHKGDGHDLAKDVEDLINDTDSAFRKHVLDIVKNSDEFEKLFDDHPELKTVISDEFKLEDFLLGSGTLDEKKNRLLKYIFKQDGVTGEYSFITRDDIEVEIAAVYNSLDPYAKLLLTNSSSSYETLDEDKKQIVRNNFYGNEEIKSAVLDKVELKFNTHKTDIVDKIAEGKQNEVTDTKALELIDELLAEYVTKYIEQEELHTDDTINASIAGVIEEILFGLISDLIHNGGDINGNGVIDNEGIEFELSAMLGHIDTVKHQFVEDATPDVVSKLKTVVKGYRNTHAEDIKDVVDDNYSALTQKLIVMINPEHPNTVYGKVEEVLISVAGTIDSSLISQYVLTLDEDSLKETIKKYMKNITVSDINKYIAAFLNASNNNVEAIKTELRDFITSSEQRATVEGLAKTYINDAENEATIRAKVSDFIDDVDEAFVASNRVFIESALTSLDLSEFVDADFVKEYVAGLDNAGKAAFADKIYNSLMSNEEYTSLMKALLNDDKLVVTKSNAPMIKAVSGVIRSLDFDKVADIINRNEIIEKLINKFGKNFVEPYYNAMLSKYCDRLDAIIAEVEAADNESYTQSMDTVLILRVDAVAMLKKLYDKAMPKVISVLEKAGIYYSDNPYLKYLVEHDIIGALVDGDASLADGDFTGYSLKSVQEYYDYILSLLIVADDAITWYGDRDELSQEQFDALYDAIIGKATYVQEQLDEILADFRATGEFPDKIQSLVDKVSKINELITRFEPKINKVIDKYFESGITVDKVANNDKFQSALDVLLGMDDPVFEIDMLYDIFYRYDDKAQAKLKQLIDSSKLRKAIDKFYETSAAEIIKGNATLGGNDKVKKLADIIDEIKSNGKVTSTFENIYDVLVILAEYGIDAYKTAENELNDVGGAYTYIEDEYTISVGDISFSVSRFYESPGWVG